MLIKLLKKNENKSGQSGKGYTNYDNLDCLGFFSTYRHTGFTWKIESYSQKIK